MTTLLDRHDLVLADLDGTLYQGREAIPGAVDAVRAVGERGVRTLYVTNNASRSPGDVAAHLAELGYPAEADDVATSSQAAAALLAEQLPDGAKVLVVGTAALVAEISAVGLTPTDTAAGATAVVQGLDPQLRYATLAEACIALRAGAVWVACNVDPTLPSERGPLPGNGSLVAVLRTATRLEPQVAGKPAPGADADRRATGRRIGAAGGRRPARHRHPGRSCGRHGDAARAHRCLRRRRTAGRARRRPGRTTSARTSQRSISIRTTSPSARGPGGPSTAGRTASSSPAPAPRWTRCARCASATGTPEAARPGSGRTAPTRPPRCARWVWSPHL